MSAGGNWDDEDFEAIGFNAAGEAIGGGKWEGEDAEDEVKESWEDFDDDADKSKQKPTDTKPATSEVVKVVKVKKKKALSEKIAEKENKEKSELDEDSEKQVVLSPEEIYEEKLRRQRLQEDADLEFAKETFGIKEEGKCSLESMRPTTKPEFDSFRTALAETITKHDKSPCYVAFLDELFRDICLNLEAEDVKKLGNTIQILGNEKLKIKTASKGKKKAGKTKASLVVGRANDYVLEDDYANDYEDFM
ncbi:hypothetical protein CHUAL_011031 [Chamberlinius hualienensis]